MQKYDTYPSPHTQSTRHERRETSGVAGNPVAFPDLALEDFDAWKGRRPNGTPL